MATIRRRPCRLQVVACCCRSRTGRARPPSIGEQVGGQAASRSSMRTAAGSLAATPSMVTIASMSRARVVGRRAGVALRIDRASTPRDERHQALLAGQGHDVRRRGRAVDQPVLDLDVERARRSGSERSGRSPGRRARRRTARTGRRPRRAGPRSASRSGSGRGSARRSRSARASPAAPGVTLATGSLVSVGRRGARLARRRQGGQEQAAADDRDDGHDRGHEPDLGTAPAGRASRPGTRRSTPAAGGRGAPSGVSGGARSPAAATRPRRRVRRPAGVGVGRPRSARPGRRRDARGRHRGRRRRGRSARGRRPSRAPFGIAIGRIRGEGPGDDQRPARPGPPGGGRARRRRVVPTRARAMASVVSPDHGRSPGHRLVQHEARGRTRRTPASSSRRAPAPG